MSFNRKKYFERIGYTDNPDVSVKTLKAIHAAQVFSIPFENLAIHELENINNPDDFIHLDEESVFKKLVIDKRGGYCHENNELLAIALLQIGFKIERLLARVLTASGLPRGHKLLLITIDDQKWIADAGFGGYGLFEPIPLIANKEETQYGDCFKLVLENAKYTLEFLETEKTWKKLYEFNLDIFDPVDYQPFNYHISHTPNSFFVQNRFCVMPTPKGRIILLNDVLKIIEHGKVETKSVHDGEYYLSILKQYFGIALPENTQFKRLKEKKIESVKAKKNISSTGSWCNYFTKVVIVAGVAGAVYLSGTAIQESMSNSNI